MVSQDKKKGVRRWQNPDGSFNEEGKRRYGRIGNGRRAIEYRPSKLTSKQHARIDRNLRRAQIGLSAAALAGVGAQMAYNKAKYGSPTRSSFSGASKFNDAVLGFRLATGVLGVIGAVNMAELRRKEGLSLQDMYITGKGKRRINELNGKNPNTWHML